jgi:uracil-DNA glycosylase family 4
VPDAPSGLAAIHADVVTCERCPRLRRYCAQVASTKRRAFRDCDYWGRPVPGFGDPRARLWVVGLAPAAHGGNRTGRVFTGDSSGDWLFRALHTAGFARFPHSIDRDDGQELCDAYVSAAARCAPPDNKPSPSELARCRPFLGRELVALHRLRVVVPLGKIAFDAVLRLLEDAGCVLPRPRPRFGHGAVCEVSPAAGAAVRALTIVASYHPSRQNTQTGKLTRPMLDAIFAAVRERLPE